MRMGFLNPRAGEEPAFKDAGVRREFEPAMGNRSPAAPRSEPGPMPGMPPISGAPDADEHFETTSEEKLLDHIGEFRESIANALYEQSRDYQILCSLTHSDFKACDTLVHELRKRLVHNVHYQVLGKLDEAYRLVVPHASARR